MNHLSATARRAPSPRRSIALAAAIASSGALILLAAPPAQAADGVTTFETQSETDAARSLLGEHVTLRSAELSLGRPVQAGTFAGLGADLAGGVALSSGSLRAADPSSSEDVDFTASALEGPNTKLTTTGDLGEAGSALLESTFGVSTYDAAELTLTVVPAGASLSIDYQIGSEEYGGWAERDYVDAFGVYVDGRLCSLVDDEPAGVATINASAHSDRFVSNLTAEGAPGDRDTELNGFSTTLTCTATVTPGEPVTVVAGVADTVDGQLDSTLILAASGISSTAGPGKPSPAPTSPGAPTSTAPTSPGDTASTVTPTPAAATVDQAAPGGRGGSLPRTGGDAGVVTTGALLAAGAIAAGATAIAAARRRAARRAGRP